MKSHRAIVLDGPDHLSFVASKDTPLTGEYQLVARVECVGLCFSDLKLLHQFDSHPRKGPVVDGIEQRILDEVPSYVPGDLPTVPGHEAVVTVVKTGGAVKHAKEGRRYLVQTDYRWLPTERSNAAFGYNFEGALQEYVLMDERVITSPEGESMLIEVPPDLSASEVALVEPWACVEDAYRTPVRRGMLEGGTLLVVADADPSERLRGELEQLAAGASRAVTVGRAAIRGAICLDELGKLPPDASFDDVIYLGGGADSLESLFPFLSHGGTMWVITCGRRFGRKVEVPVGRVHYEGIRIAGTLGESVVEAWERLPRDVELKNGMRVHVVGAAGPMGMMHVIRTFSLFDSVELHAADLDLSRLRELQRKLESMAKETNGGFVPYTPQDPPPLPRFDYVVVMVPSAALVAAAVDAGGEGCIINVFAGIPADVTAPVDMNAYLSRGMYFTGSSGSVVEDMKTVLERLVEGTLDTNLSVAAVAGLEGAIAGMEAVEKRRFAGKIVVYPACRGMALTALEEMGLTVWSRDAEKELLRRYG